MQALRSLRARPPPRLPRLGGARRWAAPASPATVTGRAGVPSLLVLGALSTFSFVFTSLCSFLPLALLRGFPLLLRRHIQTLLVLLFLDFLPESRLVNIGGVSEGHSLGTRDARNLLPAPPHSVISSL